MISRRRLIISANNNSDTIYVSSYAELIAARDACNSALDTSDSEKAYKSSKNIVLTSDIVCNSDWVHAPDFLVSPPENIFGKGFAGIRSFIGNGHTIYGLYLNDSSFVHILGAGMSGVRFKGCVSNNDVLCFFCDITDTPYYSSTLGLTPILEDCCVDFCFMKYNNINTSGALLIPNPVYNITERRCYSIYSSCFGTSQNYSWHGGLWQYLPTAPSGNSNRDADECYNASRYFGNVAGIIGVSNTGSNISNFTWNKDNIRTEVNFAYSYNVLPTVTSCQSLHTSEMKSDTFLATLGNNWKRTGDYPYLKDWNEQGYPSIEHGTLYLNWEKVFFSNGIQPLECNVEYGDSLTYTFAGCYSHQLAAIVIADRTTHKIYTSYDGVNFSIFQSVDFEITDLTEIDDTLYACCADGYLRVYNSTGSWTEYLISTSNKPLYVIKHDSTFVVAARNGYVYFSSDLVSWSSLNTGYNSAIINSIAFFNNKYIFAACNSSALHLMTSSDLTSIDSDTLLGSEYTYSAVIFKNKIWLNCSDGRLLSSSDGESWTVAANNSTEGNNGLALSPDGTKLLVPLRTEIKYTEDGTTFSSIKWPGKVTLTPDITAHSF